MVWVEMNFVDPVGLEQTTTCLLITKVFYIYIIRHSNDSSNQSIQLSHNQETWEGGNESLSQPRCEVQYSAVQNTRARSFLMCQIFMSNVQQC